MRFRGRLTLFFVLIVVVPIVAVALLVVGITSASRSGKADARLAGGVHAALAIYNDDLRRARRAATALAHDPAVPAAVAGGNRAAISDSLSSVAQGAGVESIVVVEAARGGSVLARSGSAGVAAATVDLTGAGGTPAAKISVSTSSARAFLGDAVRLTGLDIGVLGVGRVEASTAPLAGVSLPSSGDSSDVTVAGATRRATTARLPGGGLELAVVGTIPSAGFLSSKPLVAAAVAGFLGLALLLIALVLRTLSGQVSSMLAAARRIGRGDFSGDVPVVGKDEMAGLAQEFNKMSDRLQAQMDQLCHQRDEMERMGRVRLGTEVTLSERLWTEGVGPEQYGGDESKYRAAILDQYKLYCEMADRISQRRALANTFFLTLNTTIFTVLGLVWKGGVDVAAGVLLLPLVVVLGQCFAWYYIVRSYRQLNTAKYEVVGALEERLPASPYWRAEWYALGEGKDRSKYWPLSHVEQWIPVLFGVTYLAGYVAIVAS